MDDALHHATESVRRFDEADALGLARVDARRQLWTDQTEKTIVAAFRELSAAAACERNLLTWPPHGDEHLRAAQLSFGPAHTGILRRFENGVVAGIENGAGLVMSQAISGRVAVVYWPFKSRIDGQVLASADPYVVGTFEPECVTREFVLEHAAKFLTWATSYSFRTMTTVERELIGFPRPRMEPEEGRR